MQWYSAAQVAKIWGSVTATVIARIEDGSLEAVNIGKLDGERRRWRVSEKSIAAFEQARKNEPTPPPASKSSRRTIQRPVKDFFATTGVAKQ